MGKSGVSKAKPGQSRQASKLHITSSNEFIIMVLQNLQDVIFGTEALINTIVVICAEKYVFVAEAPVGSIYTFDFEETHLN